MVLVIAQLRFYLRDNVGCAFCGVALVDYFSFLLILLLLLLVSTAVKLYIVFRFVENVEFVRRDVFTLSLIAFLFVFCENATAFSGFVAGVRVVHEQLANLDDILDKPVLLFAGEDLGIHKA